MLDRGAIAGSLIGKFAGLHKSLLSRGRRLESMEKTFPGQSAPQALVSTTSDIFSDHGFGITQAL